MKIGNRNAQINKEDSQNVFFIPFAYSHIARYLLFSVIFAFHSNSVISLVSDYFYFFAVLLFCFTRLFGDDFA